MGELKPIAIVTSGNRQVLRGLTLLLEDMNFNVISSDALQKIAAIDRTKIGAPDLLVSSLPKEVEKPSINLIKDLRVLFNSQIPAILITSEYDSNNKKINEENIVTISDRAKPGSLRQKIKEILDKHLEVNCDGPISM